MTQIPNPALLAQSPDWVTSAMDSYDPEQQYAGLVAMLEADDAASPVEVISGPEYNLAIPTEQYTGSDVLEEAYKPAPDPQQANIGAIFEDAPDHSYTGHEYWENDPQFFGLGVPPGIANDQPWESGQSQAVHHVASLEAGWDAWSGRAFPPPVTRRENDFPGYNAGTSRGHLPPIEKNWAQNNIAQEMMRQQLIAELYKRGVHNVIIGDIQALPYSQTVVQVDPAVYGANAPDIGEAGVAPVWGSE